MFLSQYVKRKMINTNKNGKCESIGEFTNDVRVKKISKLHGIIVSRPVFLPKYK